MIWLMVTSEVCERTGTVEQRVYSGINANTEKGVIFDGSTLTHMRMLGAKYDDGAGMWYLPEEKQK